MRIVVERADDVGAQDVQIEAGRASGSERWAKRSWSFLLMPDPTARSAPSEALLARTSQRLSGVRPLRIE
jgi:hypothetical protein